MIQGLIPPILRPIEKALYNVVLASTSSNGKGFFYDNYLECNPGFLQFQNRRHGIRDQYHTCSCCPPNVLRLIASLDIYIYSSYKDQLVVNQFISSELVLILPPKKTVLLLPVVNGGRLYL